MSFDRKKNSAQGRLTEIHLIFFGKMNFRANGLIKRRFGQMYFRSNGIRSNEVWLNGVSVQWPFGQMVFTQMAFGQPTFRSKGVRLKKLVK
jgi:hypothetical protein